jgi:NADH dehydrogenase (ubiquinone) Fe-S protein 2
MNLRLGIWRWIRTLYGENNRISKHSMAVLSRTKDFGTPAPFSVSEERKRTMECYEPVSDDRMHAANIRPRNVIRPRKRCLDLPHGLLDDIFKRATQFSPRVHEDEEVSRSTDSEKAEPSGLEECRRGRPYTMRFSFFILRGGGTS